MPAAYEPSADVRGVAYDTGTGVLFVLDVEENAKARVVAHRFDTRETRLLWSAPIENPGAWLGLGGTNGELVLVRAVDKSYTAWRSRTDAEGQFHLDRAFEGEGEVLDQPVMGQRELLLPVRDGEGVFRLVPLWSHRFDREVACTSL